MFWFLAALITISLYYSCLYAAAAAFISFAYLSDFTKFLGYVVRTRLYSKYMYMYVVTYNYVSNYKSLVVCRELQTLARKAQSWRLVLSLCSSSATSAFLSFSGWLVSFRGARWKQHGVTKVLWFILAAASSREVREPQDADIPRHRTRLHSACHHRDVIRSWSVPQVWTRT